MDKRDFESGTNKRVVKFKTGYQRWLHVSIEQMGLLSKFEVRHLSRFQKANFTWVEAVLEVWEFDSRDEAVKHFGTLCAGYKGKGYDVTVEDHKRPVASDPQDRKYVNANLVRVSSDGSQPYNCFSVSDVVFARADGTLITQIDLDALNAFPGGQVHRVNGSVGDMQVSVHTECDSSG